MTLRHFPDLNESSASEAARPPLVRARARFGAIPRRSPVTPRRPCSSSKPKQDLRRSRTSLTPLEREVVALTVARQNGCDFRPRLHCGLVQGLTAPEGFFEALVTRAPLADARLEALRRFTEALLERTGDVGDDVGKPSWLEDSATSRRSRSSWASGRTRSRRSPIVLPSPPDSEPHPLPTDSSTNTRRRSAAERRNILNDL